MSSPKQMHNKITKAEDNKSPPVFCQTQCNMQADYVSKLKPN